MYWKTDERHGLKHNPFTALVAPRPIGWISTWGQERGPEGGPERGPEVYRGRLPNLAPYSFFNAVSYVPPQVIFSAGDRGTEDAPSPKDSLQNVLRTGCFVANLATWDLREQMNLSSAECPPDIDEFELAGLTLEHAELVDAPRVKESPVHLECRLVDTLTTATKPGHSPNVIVLGEVVGVNIDESVITDGMIDYAKTKPISRMGYLADYAMPPEPFRMRRPDWPLKVEDAAE